MIPFSKDKIAKLQRPSLLRIKIVIILFLTLLLVCSGLSLCVFVCVHFFASTLKRIRLSYKNDCLVLIGGMVSPTIWNWWGCIEC